MVRSTHHDLWASPTRLPSPKIRSVESVHPRLHMVALITGMVKTTIRSNPQIHGTIRSGEKFHIVDIGVGVTVCREFASPRYPVAIQIPIHSAIFRAPDANACRKLTICIGGTDVQREVVIILASIACSIFGPPQNIGIGVRSPWSSWAISTADEFEGFARINALIYAK